MPKSGKNEKGRKLLEIRRLVTHKQLPLPQMSFGANLNESIHIQKQ